MKMGKAKLRHILSQETGIPVRDIIDHGRYENFGNKERLVIGAHTITVLNGEVKLCEPVFKGEEIVYRSRVIRKGGGSDGSNV